MSPVGECQSSWPLRVYRTPRATKIENLRFRKRAVARVPDLSSFNVTSRLASSLARPPVAPPRHPPNGGREGGSCSGCCWRRRRRQGYRVSGARSLTRSLARSIARPPTVSREGCRGQICRNWPTCPSPGMDKIPFNMGHHSCRMGKVVMK